MNNKYKFDAFISYSHEGDSEIADNIRSAIQKIGKPWYKLFSSRVFIDKNNLAATDNGWNELKKALNQSQYLILLASPEIVESPWVKKELNYWLQECKGRKILIALTEGDIVWFNCKENKKPSDFNWDKTSALPKSLSLKFEDEPFWVDFRGIRQADNKKINVSNYFVPIAKLAAHIKNIDVDSLISEDYKQVKLARKLAILAVIILLVLSAFAINFAVEANYQEEIAKKNLEDSNRNLKQSTKNLSNTYKKISQIEYDKGNITKSLAYLVEAKKQSNDNVRLAEIVNLYSEESVRLWSLNPNFQNLIGNPKLSNDGELLFGLTPSGIGVWNTKNKMIKNVIIAEGFDKGLDYAFSRDKSTLVCQLKSGGLKVVELPTDQGKEKSILNNNKLYIAEKLSLNFNGKLFSGISTDEELVVIDIEKELVLLKVKLNTYFDEIKLVDVELFWKESDLIAVCPGDGWLEYNHATGDTVFKQFKDSWYYPVDDMWGPLPYGVNDDGSQIAYISTDSKNQKQINPSNLRLKILDFSSNKVLRNIKLPNYVERNDALFDKFNIKDLCLSTDGSVYLLSDRLIFKENNGEFLPVIKYPHDFSNIVEKSVHVNNEELHYLEKHSGIDNEGRSIDRITIRNWRNTEIEDLIPDKLQTTASDISACGKYVALGSRDGSIDVRNIHNGEKVISWKKSSCPIKTVAFAPNGLQLISLDENATIRFFDITQKKSIWLNDKSKKIDMVTWDKKGNQIIALIKNEVLFYNLDGSITKRNKLETNEVIHVFKNYAISRIIKYEQDRSLIGVQLFKLDESTFRKDFYFTEADTKINLFSEINITDVAFSSSHSKVLILCDNGEVYVKDIESNDKAYMIYHSAELPVKISWVSPFKFAIATGAQSDLESNNVNSDGWIHIISASKNGFGQAAKLFDSFRVDEFGISNMICDDRTQSILVTGLSEEIKLFNPKNKIQNTILHNRLENTLITSISANTHRMLVSIEKYKSNYKNLGEDRIKIIRYQVVDFKTGKTLWVSDQDIDISDTYEPYLPSSKGAELIKKLKEMYFAPILSEGGKYILRLDVENKKILLIDIETGGEINSMEIGEYNDDFQFGENYTGVSGNTFWFKNHEYLFLKSCEKSKFKPWKIELKKLDTVQHIDVDGDWVSVNSNRFVFRNNEMKLAETETIIAIDGDNFVTKYFSKNRSLKSVKNDCLIWRNIDTNVESDRINISEFKDYSFNSDYSIVNKGKSLLGYDLADEIWKLWDLETKQKIFEFTGKSKFGSRPRFSDVAFYDTPSEYVGGGDGIISINEINFNRIHQIATILLTNKKTSINDNVKFITGITIDKGNNLPFLLAVPPLKHRTKRVELMGISSEMFDRNFHQWLSLHDSLNFKDKYKSIKLKDLNPFKDWQSFELKVVETELDKDFEQVLELMKKDRISAKIEVDRIYDEVKRKKNNLKGKNLQLLVAAKFSTGLTFYSPDDIWMCIIDYPQFVKKLHPGYLNDACGLFYSFKQYKKAEKCLKIVLDYDPNGEIQQFLNRSKELMKYIKLVDKNFNKYKKEPIACIVRSPFENKEQLLTGDILLALNDKKIKFPLSPWVYQDLKFRFNAKVLRDDLILNVAVDTPKNIEINTISSPGNVELTINQIVPNSQAEKQGLNDGDLILKIDNKDIKSYFQIIRMLNEKKNHQIRIRRYVLDDRNNRKGSYPDWEHKDITFDFDSGLIGISIYPFQLPKMK